MAKWAIVIGIDQYWVDDACLQCAVSDALKMRAWLLDPAGAGVPETNLFLLLSPSPNSHVPEGLDYYSASVDMIITVLNRLMQKSEGQGERLFFYYSGHGILDPKTRMNSYDDVLVPTDFTGLFTNKSIRLDSILEYFLYTSFLDQFFFIDACRSLPIDQEWNHTFNVGELPRFNTPKPNAPAVQQFVLHATSPGVPAVEIRLAGNEGGAFTSTLLNGLKGAGRSKGWDPAATEYVVRVDSLFDFVKADVARTIESLNNPSLSSLLVVPMISGQRGAPGRDSNPELARFPAGTFPRLDLQVSLDPATAIPGAAIVVKRDGDVKASRLNIQNLPVHFSLLQREYSVSATAQSFEVKGKVPTVALYEPMQVTIPLEATQVLLGNASPPPSSGPATLTLKSTDRLATLELADSTGRTVMSGLGSLSSNSLVPGFYTARLHAVDGQITEQAIELLPGQDETMNLSAPSSSGSVVAKQVLAAITEAVNNDNTVSISEKAGPLVSPDMSTIISLAGVAANSLYANFGSQELWKLGLASFQSTINNPSPNCGIQLLFGVDGQYTDEAYAFLSSLSISITPIGGDQSFATVHPMFPRSAQVQGIAMSSFIEPPGYYWLQINLPLQDPISVALATLSGRLTMLVIQYSIDKGDRIGSRNRLRIFQYMPTLGSDPTSTDPDVVRSADMLQRFYQSGQLAFAEQTATKLLNDKWQEPLSGCLGGYLRLRLGQAHTLDVASSNMLRLYPDLSDSHILRAEYLAAMKDIDAALSEYDYAQMLGIPVCADGVARLYGALSHYRKADRHASRAALIENLYKQQLPGLIWTGLRGPNWLSNLIST